MLVARTAESYTGCVGVHPAATREGQPLRLCGSDTTLPGQISPELFTTSFQKAVPVSQGA